MAAKGRKPKPAAQRRREGNPGHRPIRDAIKPEGIPEKPPHLNRYAEEEWERSVPLLVEMGLAGRVSTGPLTAMCVSWGVAEEARREVETEGLVEEGSMGQMVEHPLLSTYRAAIAQYLRIATEFGMTASAAMRVEAARAGEPEPFADLGPSPRLRAVK